MRAYSLLVLLCVVCTVVCGVVRVAFMTTHSDRFIQYISVCSRPGTTDGTPRCKRNSRTAHTYGMSLNIQPTHKERDHQTNERTTPKNEYISRRDLPRPLVSRQARSPCARATRPLFAPSERAHAPCSKPHSSLDHKHRRSTPPEPKHVSRGVGKGGKGGAGGGVRSPPPHARLTCPWPAARRAASSGPCQAPTPTPGGASRRRPSGARRTCRR